MVGVALDVQLFVYQYCQAVVNEKRGWFLSDILDRKAQTFMTLAMQLLSYAILMGRFEYAVLTQRKKMSLVAFLYFAWENQGAAACCIFHIILISCITVLYESYSTVMLLIGQIQYSYVDIWANTVCLGKYSTVM